MIKTLLSLSRLLLWLCLVVVSAQMCGAYSVLTHEQIVDLLWNDDLQPLLKSRFPNITNDDLKRAHAFAYGGSLVQDMGYYPFGNKYFSDLTHYVRTGDFIVNLLDESSDLNEYAFALGALAHYSADNCGHPAINQAVALQFPKLHEKFGREVTYEDDPKAHIRTEFGFDMVQVAKNRYTSDRYHDFIGFEVAKPVLERAFLDTYSTRLSDVIANEDLAIGTFRRAIGNILPEMTRVALLARRKEMVAETPNFNSRKFRYYLSRTEYQHEWGKGYRKPGAGARILAFFLKFVPKIGPFKALDFKIPTQKTEDLYIASVNHTVEDYKHLLVEEQNKDLHLSNTDFDTGRASHVGEYLLSDNTYAHLLDRLAQHNFDHITPDLRNNILAFYGDPGTPVPAKTKPKDWQKIQEELQRLRAFSIPEKPVAGKSSNVREWEVEAPASVESSMPADPDPSASGEHLPLPQQSN